MESRRLTFKRSSTLVDQPAISERPEAKPFYIRWGRTLVTSGFQTWVDISTDVTRALNWKPRVDPYIGYGTERYSRLICRTVRASDSQAPKAPIVRGIRAALMVPASHVPVNISIDGTPLQTVQIGSSSAADSPDPTRNQVASRAISDDRGYLDLITEGKLSPGIHDVTYTVQGRRSIHAPLYTVGDNEKVAVISDLDDTVLVTNVPDPVAALRNMLFTDPKKREAVHGMASFYRQLQDVLGGAPFFYLSTSPWNIEPMLRQFISVHGLPQGPLLLRDFDPRPKTFIPSGVEHKLEFCEQLMDDFPGMKFILIGDNGQHDPQTYAKIANDHPGRVLAIGIRQLQPIESMKFHMSLHAMPDVKVPVFYGHSGDNLRRTMIPYIQELRDHQKLRELHEQTLKQKKG